MLIFPFKSSAIKRNNLNIKANIKCTGVLVKGAQVSFKYALLSNVSNGLDPFLSKLKANSFYQMCLSFKYLV